MAAARWWNEDTRSLLGAPEYDPAKLEDTLDNINASLTPISIIPDAKIAFHIRRITAWVCRITHLLRLIPPDFEKPGLSLDWRRDSEDRSRSEMSSIQDS